MFLGIDLGTSGVKAVLVDEDQRIVAQHTAPLDVSRPRPLWSEQDPEAWWQAARRASGALRAAAGDAWQGVRALGLSGQMHGATLLDAADRPLRPAILWNDGRSFAQCAALEEREPRAREITGNLAMPGFTAPKLLWVAEHEPDVHARLARVLLPKDYLRLRLTGEAVSEMSDASGTLWLDVARRGWSEAMLVASRVSPTAMPALVEGSQVSGTLRAAVADDLGLPRGLPVAGGAGDQAAGGIGAGAIAPGQGFVALGTSGVVFVARGEHRANPDEAVHAFCHALPDTWHQMAVILSAAACLEWAARLWGDGDVAGFVGAAEAEDRDCGALLFLPYLTGERTPHNDPHARGVLFGLGPETTRADVARAVLEGVAFALADGQEALERAGGTCERPAVIGGGARSRLWGRILASALDRPLAYAAAADVGPAFGAARLARLAVSGEAPAEVCTPPPVAHVAEPDPELRERYRGRRARFAALYRHLREDFGHAAR